MQTIAEKLRAEHEQRQKTTIISRHNSTSSVHSATSIEVAEITETARNAEAQIAELASHSTDEDAGLKLSLQPSNHNSSRHHYDDRTVLTPDDNIRPVAPFVTFPHGQLLNESSIGCLFISLLKTNNRFTDNPGEPVLSQRTNLLEQPLDFYEPDVLPATQTIV